MNFYQCSKKLLFCSIFLFIIFSTLEISADLYSDTDLIMTVSAEGDSSSGKLNEVHDLEVELPHQYITFEEIWNKHWLTLILLLLFLAFIILHSCYLFSINKKLTLSKLELKKHKDQLEEIVSKRTKELRDEKLKSDNANAAKSDFLSKMSHELRTPLNSILGFAQLLQIEENKNSDSVTYTDEIIIAGNFLLSLINEILDLARIESGKTELKLERVSINTVLEHSLSIVSPLVNENDIIIKINNPSEYFVLADCKRLQQICINLLSNAIKYNKKGGNIDIELVKNEHHCKISIKDSGVGIKPDFYEKVFQPFARDRENSDLIEGTGVGLVITKNLIELMHGTIGFKSEYGKGSEFWVTLPLETT